MARHRQIDVRMWGDARFLALSRPQPNAQTLWVYLLTGPHTTSIPGLFAAGEAGMSEALGWPVKAFREAFREVLKEGMAEADFSTRVVWIPKAILYNPPQSVNVVKSWRAYWDEVPECALKLKAHQHLKAYLDGMSKAFADEFSRACSRHHENSSPNQEQEQEQEQEQDKEASARSKFKPPTLEEVKAYCLSRGNSVDPQRFIDHYTANGWRVGGKSRMRDWQASVRTWEGNDFQNGKRKPTPEEASAAARAKQDERDARRKALEEQRP